VFTDRLRYPALRARPETERAPLAALTEVGFAPEAIAAAFDEFDSVAAEIFPRLQARARAIGADCQARQLETRRGTADDAKRLLYAVVRLAQPDVVVETGTYNGLTATFLLLALRANNRGRLVSLDLPARVPIPHAIDDPLPNGAEPGWIIPDELRANVEVVIGDARKTLEPTLERLGPVDLFFHDSLHTTRHMLFEYRTAWRFLKPGGILASDDAFMTPAFWWFTERRHVPFVHIGALAVTRKPLALQSRKSRTRSETDSAHASPV
jgi:predicted O-methyltransferase YrrM